MNYVIGIKDLKKVLIPEIGKIKVGEKGERRTSRNGNDYRLPNKLEYFKVKTLERGEDGNFKDDQVVMSLLEGDQPTELPIKVLHDEIDKVFPHWYSYYQGDNLVCKGNGESARWYGFKDDKAAQDKECRGENCKYRESGKCKPYGIFNSIFQGMELVGGAYKFRTSSWNSIHGILSSLKLIKSLTGGILAEIPLKMVLKPKTTTYESNGQKGITTVQVVHIEYGGSIAELQSEAVKIKKRRMEVSEYIYAEDTRTTEDLSFVEDDKDDGKIEYQNEALRELEERENQELKEETQSQAQEDNILNEEGLVCDDCGTEITDAIANYCHNNPELFNDKKVCFNCQKKYKGGGTGK